MYLLAIRGPTHTALIDCHVCFWSFSGIMSSGYGGLVGGAGAGGSYLPISSMLVYEGCTVQGTPAMGDFKWAKEYKTGLWEMPGNGKRFLVASQCFIRLTRKRFLASKLNFVFNSNK